MTLTALGRDGLTGAVAASQAIVTLLFGIAAPSRHLCRRDRAAGGRVTVRLLVAGVARNETDWLVALHYE